MFRYILMTSLVAMALSQPITMDQGEAAWQSFKTVHKRTYTGEIEILRKQIFRQNLARIEKHNIEADLGMHTYWQGVNQFTDMTNEEFRQKMTGFKVAGKNSTGSTFLAPNVQVPTHIDWRKSGYVTPVKNQGQCGSCWAFSATGSLEGQHFRKTGKLTSLSEQNLVDCSGPQGNMGCNGGLMDQAFDYIQTNHGIDTEECYEYKAEDESCKFKTACIGATVTGHVDVTPHGDEHALMQAVGSVGPVSIAIDAGHSSFQSYSHGVYNEPDCSSTQLDHGVLAVGYGTTIGDGKGTDFWIVKNSWGAQWGLSGYIHMSRNKDNQCGVATQASYPLV